jgi:hypothetical protein
VGFMSARVTIAQPARMEAVGTALVVCAVFPLPLGAHSFITSGG